MNTGTNIRLLTLFAGLIIGVSSVASFGQPSQPAPPCLETPPGASNELTLCLALACKEYQVAVENCSSTACVNGAWIDYLLARNACFIQQTNAQHEWATIWYADGKYGVAFELWDVPEHAVRFGF